MRLINADALKEIYEKWLSQLENPDDAGDKDCIKTCIAELEDAPTIEAVPVVRCLKCKHERKLTYAERIRFTSDCVVCMHPYGPGVSYPEYKMDGRVVWKSDYCMYGEPKQCGGDLDGNQADPV